MDVDEQKELIAVVVQLSGVLTRKVLTALQNYYVAAMTGANNFEKLFIFRENKDGKQKVANRT